MPTEQNWERSVPQGTSWGNCRVCRHFRPDRTCSAYPEPIPSIIASGEVDHLSIRLGQLGGDAFEPATRPSSLALRTLRHAAEQGAPWAVAAFARAEASAPH